MNFRSELSSWRGLQAAASRLVSMPGASKSVETSLDAADRSVRATRTLAAMG
jgi:hypothetical protein